MTQAQGASCKDSARPVGREAEMGESVNRDGAGPITCVIRPAPGQATFDRAQFAGGLPCLGPLPISVWAERSWAQPKCYGAEYVTMSKPIP